MSDISRGIQEDRLLFTGNLDFDAKVPIPFSVFPSSYRSEEAGIDITRVKVEGEANLPSSASRVEREGHESRYSSYSATLPDRKGRTRYEKEDVRVSEEDRDRHPRHEEDVTIYRGEDRIRDNHAPEVELSRER